MPARGSRATPSGSPRLGIAQLCVPSDTQLRLEGIPEALQNKFGVGPYEEVTFIHVDHGCYRDGINFRNGTDRRPFELSEYEDRIARTRARMRVSLPEILSLKHSARLGGL